MSREPEEVLRNALEHFEILDAHAQEDLGSQLVVDAICMRLSAGIEVLAGLDPALRDELFGGAWALMWGMRNRIAHGYLLVNSEIVRATVSHDVPDVVRRIRTWLDHQEP